MGPPDTGFLDRPGNRDDDALRYSLEALKWLDQAVADGTAPWAKAVDGKFLAAARTVVGFFEGPPDAPAGPAVNAVLQNLAEWRGDFRYDPAHPMAHLGRVLRGDPGGQLEYRGPVFTLTTHDVLEGLTQEYLEGDWDHADRRTARLFLFLAAALLGDIAQACYWAAKGAGSNLDVELGRLFAKDNREALPGQLANLALAGQVMTWGEPVTFIPEPKKKAGDEEADLTTPDWYMSGGSLPLYVECTSFKRNADTMNDLEELSEAVRRGWKAKAEKFHDQFRPGVVAVDASGVFLDREFGRHFQEDLFAPWSLGVPGGQRDLGAYALGDDTEMLQHESFARRLLGLFASILYSKEARDRGIRGVLLAQGMQVVVDTCRHAVVLPKRGVLAWRGETGEEDEALFQKALYLCGPAAPLETHSVGRPLVNAYIL